MKELNNKQNRHYLTFVLSKDGVAEKPKAFGKLRAFTANSLHTMDIFMLADFLKQGYSIHPSCLLTSLNQEKTKHGNPTKYYNDTCFDASRTTLYAVDVDHGNFDINSLKELIEVPYAMIYKTFSYREEDNRRYRVLFIGHRPPKDKEEWTRIQQSLMYQFMHPYEGEAIETVEGSLDFSHGVSRLVLGSTSDSIIDVKDEVFNVDELLVNNAYITEQFEDLKNLWEIEKKRREGEDIDEEELSLKKEQNRLKGRAGRDTSLLEETNEHKTDRLFAELMGSLLQIKEARLIEIPNMIDVGDMERWTNLNLPLSLLFKRPGQFNCLLIGHKDSTPSAGYLTHKHGYEVLHCQGCRKTKTSFQFISHLLKEKFGYDLFETTKFLCEFLNIEIGSPWQREAIDRIRYNLAYIKNMPPEAPLKKRLIRSNLLGIYEEMLNLALIKLPLEPFDSIPESQKPCFFVSFEYLSTILKEKGFRGVGSKSKVYEKVGRLTEMGLIEKIPYKDLTPEARTETEKYRKVLSYYEHLSANGEVSSKPIKSNHITFYWIPSLSVSLIDKTEELQRLKDTKGVREGELSWSKMASIYGEDRANEIVPQAKQARQTKTNQRKTKKEKYSKEERRFIRVMNRIIETLINKKQWFTIHELRENLKKSRFSENQINTYIKRFFHEGEVSLPIVFKKRINKEIRNTLNIPSNINTGSIIYHLRNN